MPPSEIPSRLGDVAVILSTVTRLLLGKLGAGTAPRALRPGIAGEHGERFPASGVENVRILQLRADHVLGGAHTQRMARERPNPRLDLGRTQA